MGQPDFSVLMFGEMAVLMKSSINRIIKCASRKDMENAIQIPELWRNGG